MSQKFEIEFKNMLEETEFNTLCLKFDRDESTFFKQTNDYFDTPTFALKNAHAALRIRHLSGEHDFTLKQPRNGIILETHQQLSDQESSDLIHYGVMPEGALEKAIDQMGINVDQLIHVGELITKRTEFPYKQGELFFDRSAYLGIQDFELEYEAEEQEQGKQIFLSLLSEFHIPRRKSKSKMMRLYEHLDERRKTDE
ncbi:CYTH domain-containing protein [Sporolactobacillus vineae]|uniref:CYTH domain-containing protein n=1 Tax=Sporolactobacillus vineae TaxID=444463 RepID=UPI0002890928|nr:CYTH domain-containing protein [Sporolactobacillus vineae]